MVIHKSVALSTRFDQRNPAQPDFDLVMFRIGNSRTEFRNYLCHGNKGIVIHFLNTDRAEHGLHKNIEEQDDSDYSDPVNQ